MRKKFSNKSNEFAIETDIEIEAPLSTVWRVLVEVEDYGIWNPFITYRSGRVEEGEVLDFLVNLTGAQTTPTKVKIVKLEQEKSFVWVGNFMNIPGLIDGTHGLELEGLSDQRTRLSHWERFNGALLPVLGGFTLDRVKKGIEMMNSATKWRAEKLFAMKDEKTQLVTFSEGGRVEVTSVDPRDLAQVHWDAIIVGTGMGGGTLGAELSKGGQKVLFLEKGEDYLSNPEAIVGHYPEVLKERETANHQSPLEKRMRNGGRWWGEVFDSHHGWIERPHLGAGVGGSTALSNMVMERFAESDFQSRKFHLKDKESTLPESWPISYSEMVPFYEKAESLYRVDFREGKKGVRPQSGEGEGGAPVRVPRHMATRIFERMIEMKGLHTFSLPYACDWKKGCQFCQGWLCNKQCKNDSNRIAVRVALESGRASLLTGFRVDQVLAAGNEVSGVRGYLRGSQEFEFHGKNYFLAAGALMTPLLLLASASERWPQGLANGSGAVGRNLMRQLIDVYFLPSVWDFSKLPYTLREHGFDDFYLVDGVKYGTVQCFGKFRPGEMYLEEVLFHLLQRKNYGLATILKWSRPLVAQTIDFILNRSGLSGAILEDLPQWDNRVSPLSPALNGRERIAIYYRMSDYDSMRLKQFRKMVVKSFFPYLYFRIQRAENMDYLGHVSGTVRFGSDPKTSVLNSYNRAHEVPNLYVVDSSFFPSSGGTLPGLTIAANALRVADHLLKHS